MTERNDRLLATVRKNGREEIRVTRGDFKGYDIVGLRVWFEDRDSGEMRPGKDGLAFRAELVDEIIEALRAAKDGAPMTARREKAPPRAATAESTIYLDRDVAGTVIVERKGRVSGARRGRQTARNFQDRPRSYGRDPRRSASSAGGAAVTASLEKIIARSSAVRLRQSRAWRRARALRRRRSLPCGPPKTTTASPFIRSLETIARPASSTSSRCSTRRNAPLSLRWALICRRAMKGRRAEDDPLAPGWYARSLAPKVEGGPRADAAPKPTCAGDLGRGRLAGPRRSLNSTCGRNVTST